VPCNCNLINSFILSSAVRIFGPVPPPFFLFFFFFLAASSAEGSTLPSAFFFSSSYALTIFFCSFSIRFCSRILASSSISAGVFSLCCLKKKLTTVARMTESHRMQPVRVFYPAGNGLSSLYCAVIKRLLHSSHFCFSSTLTAPAPVKHAILKLQLSHLIPQPFLLLWY